MSTTVMFEALQDVYHNEQELKQVLGKLLQFKLEDERRRLAEYARDLRAFEEQYEMDSAEMNEKFESGELGDAMDLGKLLQENAEGGEVLISQATYNLVGGVFECEPLEPRKIKDDRSDFTVMYRVMRLKKRTAPLSLEELGF